MFLKLYWNHWKIEGFFCFPACRGHSKSVVLCLLWQLLNRIKLWNTAVNTVISCPSVRVCSSGEKCAAPQACDWSSGSKAPDASETPQGLVVFIWGLPGVHIASRVMWGDIMLPGYGTTRSHSWCSLQTDQATAPRYLTSLRTLWVGNGAPCGWKVKWSELAASEIRSFTSRVVVLDPN